MQSQHPDPTEQHGDPELDRVVSEEERCLGRVLDHVRDRSSSRVAREESKIDYDAELVSLRDQIANARLEDVPPLVEQMERLTRLAAKRREITEGYVDVNSPYFGRLVLQEGERKREVLIGRSTYLEPSAGVRIVDWRDAPVSRLYYRYEEGEEYEEEFGERLVEGEVLTRRSVAIIGGALRRIGSPQGTFVRRRTGEWKRADESTRLHGGQGTATRAEQFHEPGKLGTGGEEGLVSEDKSLKEITALIDPRQFDLITSPDSGLVVIQGGAGSGKTTIGLHRLAYLAFQDKRRFRPDKMLVIVYNAALVRYISHVLPALGVSGVTVRTFGDWATRVRAKQTGHLPVGTTDETPLDVVRFKKHPVVLELIDRYAAELAGETAARLEAATSDADEAVQRAVLREWERGANRPLLHRAHALHRWARESKLPSGMRVAIERLAANARDRASDPVSAWAEIMSDRERVAAALADVDPEAFSERVLERVMTWCSARASRVLDAIEAREEQTERRERKKGERPPPRDELSEGVDGVALEEKATLDHEDDTLMLLLVQRLRGSLAKGGGKGGNKEALVYEHILADEAQDLSPVELAVVMGCCSKAQSVTLSGDIAQRLDMNNSFEGWTDTMSRLGLSHVAVEPLELSYRSTHEIIDFARHVLGPLAPEKAPLATRSGAPIEMFRFAHTGDAAGFLAEQLRQLMQDEPFASVAVIARFPEQADLYHAGLVSGEVPALRRIADQDFPFKPGVDVTDVRQVKGLEFDYVVLVEVSDSTYPADDESRHLLHIGATRAAHQLWRVTTGTPSPLLPEDLREQGY